MLGRGSKKIFNRDRKTLYMMLSIVLVSVFSLSIAYSALNSILKINGTAEVVASSWDIHLDNINVSIGSVKGDAPSITSPTTATFSTKLTTPGDFYEFTIDVVNDGSIDAMIDSVVKTPTLTESQLKYLNYIVEYQNGEAITTNQLVESSSFVRLKVRVEFRKDLTASDLPTTTEMLNLSFTVNYVQSNNSGSSVINGGVLKAKVEEGTGTNIGDKICIGKECFYVISSTDNTVTMLAQYNLLVGHKNDSVNGVVGLENPTGIQDKLAKGWFGGYSVNNPMIGTHHFSSINFWKDLVVSYPAYVYNENSRLYSYVEKYKNYLEILGASINEVRLITLEELENLGCSSSNNSCDSAPSWVYATSYWSGNACSLDNILSVFSDGSFVGDYYSFNRNGIRPVITISKDEIIGIVKPIANGSLDEIGTVVTIGSEQFYTIGTEGDNVKLLSMYNLHVGNKFDSTNGAVSIENPTGIQDESAKGWFSGYSVDNPLIGTKTFSSTNYWSSEVSGYPAYVYNEESYLYNYLEEYKNYLEFFNVINKVRLITLDELENLGCSSLDRSCVLAPEWVYSTSYWSGNASSSTNIWRVHSDGNLGANDYSNDNNGVRPVIFVSKYLF